MAKQIPFEKKPSEPVDIRRLSAFMELNIPLLPNGLWQLEICKPNRTNLENRTLHGWLRLISESEGIDQRTLYEHYCEMFLPLGCSYFKNGKMDSGGTSKLNTKQFAQFLTEIQADVAAEYAIVLPTSEDEAFNDFYNSYIR